jgi:hypothetical protein
MAEQKSYSEWLLSEHEAGVRCILIADLKASFPGVDHRTWQSWRERCGVPKGVHRGSCLSAVKLWVLASHYGKKTNKELAYEVAYRLKTNPASIQKWLSNRIAPPENEVVVGQGVDAVISAMISIAPDVAPPHRARLYEWFDRAGLRFSTRKTYTERQLLRVIGEARRSQRRGGWGSVSRMNTAC